MNAPPLVSVIMANYNGGAFIHEAVCSVMAQSMPDWELIVVDDASDDDSLVAARRAANGDARIRMERQPRNAGPAAARNRALDLARGRWIAVFDSDDLMAADRLERLLARARKDEAEIVADNLTVFSIGRQPKPFLPPRLTRAPVWIDLADFIDSNRLYARTPDLGYLKPMFRTEALIGLRYDESLRIGEDYHFLAGLLARGARLRLEPDALYYYRRHAGSTSHRLAARDLRALIDAERRFGADHPHLSRRARTALARRRRSLESLLIYDRVVEALKGAAPGRGAVLAASHPRIWPLLTAPLKARLARLVQA